MYFAPPGGTLAIFCRDVDYSRGLAKLRSVGSGADRLASLRGTVALEVLPLVAPP